jgi:putative transposase
MRHLRRTGTLDEAQHALERFEERWDPHFPAITRSWRAHWSRLTVMFDYPPPIRRAIYTTNAIESLNYSMRTVLKKRGAFPNDEAILKVLYLALNRIAKKWTMPISNWKAALNQFAIMFSDRITL